MAFLRKSWNCVNWLITDTVILLHTHCTVTAQALAGLQQQRRIRGLKLFLSHLSAPLLWQMSPCQKWEHLKTLLAEYIPHSWKTADWHTGVNEISLVLHAVTTEILTSDPVQELTAGGPDSHNCPVLIFIFCRAAEALKCYDKTVCLLFSLEKEVRDLNGSWEGNFPVCAAPCYILAVT